ncbi:hypothetical protein BDV93DRAFT_520132 [Ceratobasidium sp. AG-I]|nr:hypothetical protein BDV93DRAFT_520132 [Ceratobasidium sp. AG-I]
MCNTVLSRTSTSSSQYSSVSTVFDTEPSSTAESETDWSPSECAAPTKLFVELKPRTEFQKDTEGHSSSSDDDRAKASLPTRQPKRTPTMSVHDKLRAGMYTAVPLTPDNLHRYMDAYATQCPSTPRLRRARSETPSQHMAQSCEGKSGWERMKESVRKMEREAAAREKEKEGGVAKWRVGVSAWD